MKKVKLDGIPRRKLERELLRRALARTEQSIRDVHVALANLTEKRFNQQAELRRHQ
jgi:hypothetical protein